MLVSQLKTNPEMGISLGQGCYKIRISIASKGKGNPLSTMLEKRMSEDRIDVSLQ